MAAIDEMKVKISADIKDLVSQLDKGGTSLQQFAKQTTTVSNKLGTDVKSGSDRAGQALMNLGRIAQDAPFGFIGISNNINPLLESFQRLQAESGSTSGTLKALAGSLIGGGGLGLAISVATGLLTVFAQHGLFNTTKSAEGAKKAVDDYGNSLKSIVSDLSKEATQVSSLVAALQSDTLARQQKVTALKELQSIAPDYFGNLKLEHGLVNNLTAAYGAYLSALKERFKVRALDNDLDKLFSKKLDLEIHLDQGSKVFLDKATNDHITQLEGRIEELGGRKILLNADFTKYTQAQKEVSDLLTIINTLQSQNKIGKITDNALTNDLNTVNKQIDGLLSKRGQLSNFDIKFTADPKEHIKSVEDVIKELNKEIQLNQKLADIGFISSEEQDLAKITKVKSAIEELLKLPKGRGLAVGDPVITKLIASIEPEEARTQLSERLKEVVKTIRPNEFSQTLPDIQVPINIKPSISTDKALFDIDQKIRDDFNKLTKDIQKSVLDSGLASIGDVIGTAIGGGNVANAFQGLLQVVINGMKQLGEAMIGLGTAKTILEKFNIVPGVGTIAAGIGIIALSSLIQSALPKFAEGVTGFGGGVALVGERGPEIVQLPQGSNVIPNHRLGGITGGGVQVFIPDLRFRGSDLLIAFNRANLQNNRRG